MGTIVKAYTFVAGTTIIASAVNRDFDDIYNEFNGSINSTNISNAFTWPASNITFNDTAGAFSSVNAEGAIAEARVSAVTGFNSIEILAGGCAGFFLLPGVTEVNGQYRTISAVTLISSCAYTFITGAIQTGVFAVLIGTATYTGITPSDVRLALLTTVSPSDGMDNTRLSFYHSTTFRVIGTLYNAVGEALFRDHGYLQRPASENRLSLTHAEASAAGFNSLDGVLGGGTTGGLISHVVRYIGGNNMYGYRLIGRELSAATTNFTIPSHPVSSAWFMESFHTRFGDALEYYDFFDTGASLRVAISPTTPNLVFQLATGGFFSQTFYVSILQQGYVA